MNRVGSLQVPNFSPAQNLEEYVSFYSIKDWDELFENSESRKYKNLKWVPVPNKHDGKTFSRLRSLENRVEIFAAWVLILEVASKMPIRGVLVDSDLEPLTPEDLGVMTGFPSSIFEQALKTLILPKFGWIVESSENPADASEIPPLNRIE